MTREVPLEAFQGVPVRPLNNYALESTRGGMGLGVVLGAIPGVTYPVGALRPKKAAKMMRPGGKTTGLWGYCTPGGAS